MVFELLIVASRHNGQIGGNLVQLAGNRMQVLDHGRQEHIDELAARREYGDLIRG